MAFGRQETADGGLTPVQFAALQAVANRPGIDQRTLARHPAHGLRLQPRVSPQIRPADRSPGQQARTRKNAHTFAGRGQQAQGQIEGQGQHNPNAHDHAFVGQCVERSAGGQPSQPENNTGFKSRSNDSNRDGNRPQRGHFADSNREGNRNGNRPARQDDNRGNKFGFGARPQNSDNRRQEGGQHEGRRQSEHGQRRSRHYA